MKTIYKFLSILISIYLLNGFVFASRDIKRVKSIEFKDLYYISKYEIIDKVDVKVNDRDIIIDIESLENVLNDLSIIKSYNIFEMDRRLIISVVEKEPAFVLIMREGKKNIPIELDKGFQIISVNRVHAPNTPIIISNDDIKKGNVSILLKKFLTLMISLSKSNLRVMKEIEEIDFTNSTRIKILLRGRRTAFFLKPDSDSFLKLNYSAGYFDRIKYYPRTFQILNGSGIIK